MASVTEILDYYLERPLVEWMLRDPKKAAQISKEALRVGTAVDQIIQDHSRGVTWSTPTDTAIGMCLENWSLFLHTHRDFYKSIQGLQMEVIYQDVLGHPDFVRQLPNGSWGIDDLKCATQIRPSHFAQLGGYAWLMQQST